MWFHIPRTMFPDVRTLPDPKLRWVHVFATSLTQWRFFFQMDIIYCNFTVFDLNICVVFPTSLFTTWWVLRNCLQITLQSKQWIIRNLREMNYILATTKKFTGPWTWKKLSTSLQIPKSIILSRCWRSLKWRLALSEEITSQVYWTRAIATFFGRCRKYLNDSFDQEDTATTQTRKTWMTWTSTGTNFSIFTESANLALKTVN